MRVTANEKTATRSRILETAVKLFGHHGWNGTTTREIAARAGIAVGTLFNYFPTKEAIAAALVGEALEQAERVYEAGRRGAESLGEDLFLYIWAGFRSLSAYRGFLGQALETLLSPLVRPSAEHPGEAIRAAHLAGVERIFARHGQLEALTPVRLHLYWTLYLGMLAHWAADESSHQEDSLAMVDQSLGLFVGSFEPAGESAAQEVTGESQAG